MSKVQLVGAGPGAPMLLTLAGQQALRDADVVVYDRLVHPEMLAWAPTAEHVYVGKLPGSTGHYTPQESINALLIDHARAGKRVVRLKGGDPLLFGRGGEEALALADAGVDFEIIPGVTAALAAGALTGVPLTHRGLASAVCFITGHEDPTKPAADLDWQSLAGFPGTIVVYMGLAKIDVIAQRLITHGKAGDTPVLFVENATLPQQRTISSSLADCARSRPTLVSPMLAIIGPVVTLHDRLDWPARRPLAGQRILLLRPAGQEDETRRQLVDLGADVINHPVLRLDPPTNWAPIDDRLRRLPDVDWLVFTSRVGVTTLLDRLWAIGLDQRVLGNVKLAAIGPGTADELWRRHLRPDLVPTVHRSEALADALAPRVVGQRILLARADRGRDVLPTQLQAAGARCVETLTIYQQIDLPAPAGLNENIIADQLDWVMITSSNIARGFAGWLTESAKTGIRHGRPKVASISPVTTAALMEVGISATVEASVHTPAGMIDALLTHRRQ